MILKVTDNYRERLHQCTNIQGRHLSDVLFKTCWCKTAFCVLSRNKKKPFAVSSLVLNLLASQIGEFFLPHPVYSKWNNKLVPLEHLSEFQSYTSHRVYLFTTLSECHKWHNLLYIPCRTISYLKIQDFPDVTLCYQASSAQCFESSYCLLLLLHQGPEHTLQMHRSL